MAESNLAEVITDFNSSDESCDHPHIRELQNFISSWGVLDKIGNDYYSYILTLKNSREVKLRIQNYETDFGRGLTISTLKSDHPYILSTPFLESEEGLRHYILKYSS